MESTAESISLQTVFLWSLFSVTIPASHLCKHVPRYVFRYDSSFPQLLNKREKNPPFWINTGSCACRSWPESVGIGGLFVLLFAACGTGTRMPDLCPCVRGMMDGMPGTGHLQTFAAHLFVVSRMLQDCCANGNGTSDHQHKPCVPSLCDTGES